MFTHILAEIIGTLVYVGSHHISHSNPLITSGSLLIAMSLLNQFAGNVGVSLNPLASLISFLTNEQPFIEIVWIIGAQVLTVFGLYYMIKTFL
jgi:hypothetical protein